MSWDQSYSVPSLGCLLEKLAGISSTQLLIDHLEAKGLKIVNVEDVVLAEGMYENVKGTKVVLSDGRVYIPKLVERVTANGNYGNDIYEWCLVGEEPEVVCQDVSEPVGVATPEELAAAEADLYSDDEEEDNLYGGGCSENGCGCEF